MTLGNRKAMLLLCAAAIAGFSGAASARPLHHHRHHSHHRAVHISTRRPLPATVTNSDTNQRLAISARETQAMATGARPASGNTAAAAGVRPRASVAEPAASASLLGGLSGSSLVADARRYIGTNPTGRSSLWCGAFMDKVLKDAGLPGGGNLALGYLHYGHRVAGPQVGAIAVMGRAARRPRRRRQRPRSERQSDHRFRQSQPDGRGIGLSARAHHRLCDAGRLSGSLPIAKYERPAYAPAVSLTRVADGDLAAAHDLRIDAAIAVAEALQQRLRDRQVADAGVGIDVGRGAAHDALDHLQPRIADARSRGRADRIRARPASPAT